MTTAERKLRVLALAAQGELPKNIAVEVGFHYATVRRLLREGGFTCFYVSADERRAIEQARKKIT